MSLLSPGGDASPREPSTALPAGSGALGRRWAGAELAALVWSALVASALFWLFKDRGFDDPYITYRYAANLASGAGFVYNVGERVLSTTTPLYTLVLAAAGLLGLDIPLASNMIGCASLALGGLAFWWLGTVWRARMAGLVGLLLYPTLPLVVTTLGAETAFYITLILLGFLAYAYDRYVLAAVFLALATLTRADGALAAIVVGGHFLIARRRPPPWRAVVVYVVLLIPWFAFAWVYFGAPLPVTLVAKQRQGMMAISQKFFAGLLQQGRVYLSYPTYWLHFVLAALGLIYALARQRPWLIVPAWSALYVAAYTALGVTSYFWYYGPVAPGFVALIGLGTAALHRLVRRVIGDRSAHALAAAIVIALLFPESVWLNYSAGHTLDTRMTIYRTAGLWLHEHTPPDASVGTLEVGAIGYYAERRMIDFAGLIEPEVALQLGPATTYDDTARWAVQRFRPSYLLLQQGLLARLEQDVTMAGCRQIQTFQDPGYTFPLVVYACPAGP
jgi:hypothetical protein